MNVAELLKQEKGKYTSYEPHYKELKNTPFAYINGRKLEDMKVISYHYNYGESLAFGLDLKFKGKSKDKVLVIIWER